MADLNALIAQGVQFKAPPDPFAQYAQMQQLQQGQTANELARYQLSSAQRADELATNRLGNLRAAGADPAKVANALLQSGDTKGYSEFMKSRGEQEKMQTEAVDAKLKQSKQFLDTIDPTDPNAPTLYMQWHKANHSDPVLGPVLAARGITPEQSMDRIKKALEAGPAAFATLLNQSKLGTEKFIELNKPTTQVIDRSGQRDVIQTPGLGGSPTTVGTYSDVPLPADVAAQKAEIARAGSTKINMPPVAKSLAGPVGSMAEASLAQAKGAVETMNNANNVREALNTGNVIAGPMAGVRTKFAQVLELAGAGDKEKLAATRTAIQGLAAITLESRSALKGQGQITDFETNLLEKARSGNIADMTIGELHTVVDVSQRLAQRQSGNHETLMTKMRKDPNAQDVLPYYEVGAKLPAPVLTGKPKAVDEKRKAGLANIFGSQ